MCIKQLNFNSDADPYREVLLWESDEFLLCWPVHVGVCVSGKHTVVLLRAAI